MDFIKKKEKVAIFIFLICFLPFITFLNYNITQKSYDSTRKPKYPKANEAPLYQLEWAHIDSSRSDCMNLIMSSTEDIYMVSYGGSFTTRVIKYDKNGNLIWEEISDGSCHGIALDSSNNVYVSGYDRDDISGYYDLKLYKYSTSGSLLWSRTFNKKDFDYAYGVAVDNSNNVYVVGQTHDSGTWANKDVLLVKYSNLGTLLWDRLLNVREEDVGVSLTTDSSNNIYICGNHRDFSTVNDIFIAKYNDQGDLQWSKNWGVWNEDQEVSDIILDSANNIYLSGTSYVSATLDDVIIIKFNSAGNVQWSRKWGGDGLDSGNSIDLDFEGNIYIGGATYEQSSGLYDILLMTYNSAGTLKWWDRWGNNRHDVGRGIAVTSSKNVYIGGHSDDDLALIKYNLAPIITISSPTPNSLYAYTAPSFSVEIMDTDLLEKYYKVNDGITRSFTSSSGTVNQVDWDACDSGLVSLKFYGRDIAGSVYEEVIVRKDIIPPNLDIIAPIPYQLYSDIAPNYELITNESEIDSMWFTLNGEGNYIITNFKGIIDQDAWYNLDNGSVLIEFFIKDLAGNIGSKIIEVYKNYEFPLIYINNPLQNQICYLDAPIYNISITSLWSIDEIWYSLNNGKNNTIIKTVDNILQSEWNLIDNGTVVINFYAKNTLGNIGSAEVRVYKDIYFPSIKIYEPFPNQPCGISAPRYNVSISSVILESKWYTLNHGQNFLFFDNTGIIDQNAWDLCENGTVIITFYANNTAGVINFKEFSVYKDYTRPNITILAPNAHTLYGLEIIDFELSIEEPYLEQTWYSLNNGNNYSFSGLSGTFDENAWNSCENGTVMIKFYANNTFGNIGTAEIIIHKDVYFPFITIISPESEQVFGIKAPNYNISVSTLNIDSMWYSINAGMNKSILTTSGTIDQFYWDIFGNENITITFYVNNSYNQFNFKSVDIRKDINTPNITIISPKNYELFGIETIDFNVTIIDPNLDTTWYTLNDGNVYIFTGNTGKINHTAWELCGNGTITIRFYANNTIGNIGDTDLIVYRDIYFPFIKVNSPSQGQLTGLISPKFNLSISSLSIDFMWYTLNYGEKMFFTNIEGVIDQSKWDLYGEETITISFYANNSYGQLNSEEIIVKKIISLEEKNAYAIVIGISNYPGTKYDLSYCDDDAIAIYNMLISDYNFKPENIIYLQDSNACKSDIDNAFNKFASIINPHDIFFFYYSGHGGGNTINAGIHSTSINSPHPYPNDFDNTWEINFPDTVTMRVHFSQIQLEYNYDYLFIGDTDILDGYYYQSFTGTYSDIWSNWIPLLNDNKLYLRLISDNTRNDWGFRVDKYELIRYDGTHYLCSYDSIPDNPSNYYLDTLFDSKLVSLNCDEKYVILDSCNSGGFIPEVQDIGRYIMTACTGSQSSAEYSSLQHGAFTYYFLESLEKASDQNGDNVISLEECYSYTYSKTTLYSGSDGTGYRFLPQLYDGIDGQSVLYTSIGSLSYKFVRNRLYYSFYLYGTGELNTLNISLCSISPEIQIKTVEIKNLMVSYTGFGFYFDYIELNSGNNITSFEILCKVQGNNLITIRLSFGDSDGDGISDIFEVSNGLDPFSNDAALDPDNDLLTNLEEYQHNTHPFINDTDNDGLLDGEEVYTYGTDPLLIDTDTDGLSDGDEVNKYGTNPLSGDTDLDKMPDKWELDNLLDPLNNDAHLDPDKDHLVNILEYQHNTNPQNPDTDGDGWNDGDEVIIHGTDPLDPDSHPHPKKSESIPGYTMGLLIVIISLTLLFLIKKSQEFFRHC